MPGLRRDFLSVIKSLLLLKWQRLVNKHKLCRPGTALDRFSSLSCEGRASQETQNWKTTNYLIPELRDPWGMSGGTKAPVGSPGSVLLSSFPVFIWRGGHTNTEGSLSAMSMRRGHRWCSLRWGEGSEMSRRWQRENQAFCHLIGFVIQLRNSEWLGWALSSRFQRGSRDDAVK